MWHWAFDLIRVRQARNAAVAAITPLVEESRRRLGDISELRWLDPYLIGFIVMLITVVAKAASNNIDGNALCTVQNAAWKAITGEHYDDIGKDVLLLSRERNLEFERGCQAALWISPSICRDHFRSAAPSVALEPEQAEGDDVLPLWAQVFDVHVLARADSDIAALIRNAG